MSSVSRDDFVDEIRGFALLGIVLVNVPFLALSSTGYNMPSLATSGDQIAAFLTVAFAQAKFYLLFSFLFGYSLSYLLRNDSRVQRSRFGRRLLALALFGALHAALAFVGDILLLYSILGVTIFWLIRWQDRSLLFLGSALLVCWWLLLLVLGASLENFVESDVAVVDRSFDHSLATGDFLEASSARLRFWPEAFLFIALINGPAVLAMFAFGSVAGRHRLLAEPAKHVRFWRRSAVTGWAIGLPLGAWSAYRSVGSGVSIESVHALQGVLVGFAGAAPLSLAYVATLALVRDCWPKALGWAQSPGRMSLTSYICESLMLSLIFCGYGIGLYGEIGAATAALCGIAVWLLLDAFARLWLSHFKQGPLEMAMRWMVR